MDRSRVMIPGPTPSGEDMNYNETLSAACSAVGVKTKNTQTDDVAIFEKLRS